MEKVREDTLALSRDFEKFKTAMVSVRLLDAKQSVKNGSVGVEEYKILSLNLMDEFSKRSADDINKACDIVDRWVMKLRPCEWQGELVEFCETKADIVQAFAAFNHDKQDFIIVMEDSTIDDSVLEYNGFGFDMLKKYKEINDFMILDVYSSENIQYMYDEIEEIYKRG